MEQKASSGEEGPRIGGGDGGQGIADGSADALPGARAHAAQRLFGLGKGLLDRVEVRGVGGQKDDLTAGGFDERLGPGALVDGEVVEDHDLSWVQARHQHLFHERFEDAAVDGPATSRLSPMPVAVRVANQEIASRRPRGTRPTARCPRGARARSGVSVVGVLVSSKKTKASGSTVAMTWRHPARAASSRSTAIRLFF